MCSTVVRRDRALDNRRLYMYLIRVLRTQITGAFQMTDRWNAWFLQHRQGWNPKSCSLESVTTAVRFICSSRA